MSKPLTDNELDRVLDAEADAPFDVDIAKHLRSVFAKESSSFLASLEDYIALSLTPFASDETIDRITSSNRREDVAPPKPWPL